MKEDFVKHSWGESVMIYEMDQDEDLVDSYVSQADLNLTLTSNL